MSLVYVFVGSLVFIALGLIGFGYNFVSVARGKASHDDVVVSILISQAVAGAGSLGLVISGVYWAVTTLSG